MELEETFRKLHGKLPSEGQRAWLMKVQQTLGLRDNDAFWFVVMMLEHYDGLYREYPDRLAQETSRAVEGARTVFAEAARAEAAEVQRRLADEVAKTSVEVARRLAEKPLRLHHVTAALGLIVLFGALCLAAGFKLATGARPFWVGEDGTRRMSSLVLGAPAGWMTFVLLLPAAAYVLRSGWTAAADLGGNLGEKATGWALVAISIVATFACAVMLMKVV